MYASNVHAGNVYFIHNTCIISGETNCKLQKGSDVMMLWISVVTIVADYRKIVAEVSNRQQLIASFSDRYVTENSGILNLL